MNCHAWNEKGTDSQDVAMTTWRGEANSTKDSNGYFKWVFDSTKKLDVSNNNVSVIFTTSNTEQSYNLSKFIVRAKIGFVFCLSL